MRSSPSFHHSPPLPPLVLSYAAAQTFNLKLNPARTSLGDLKHLLCAESNVLPTRMKLVGIKFDRKLVPHQQQQQRPNQPAPTPGSAPEDVLLLSAVEVNWKKGIIMLGRWVAQCNAQAHIQLPQPLSRWSPCLPPVWLGPWMSCCGDFRRRPKFTNPIWNLMPQAAERTA